MRKINRIIMISVSVLLSLVLITSSVLSGTFAKYVTGEKSASSNTGRAAKWGITVDVGDHLETQYSNAESKIVVNTTGTTDVIAPGTSGSLAWFRIKGDPEVKFDIDLSGTIDIGQGFWSYDDVFKYKRDTLYPQYKDKTNEEIKGLLEEDEFSTMLETCANDSSVKNKKEVRFYDENGNEIEYFPIIIYCVEYDMLSDGSKIERSRSCIQRTTVDQNGTTVEHRYFDKNVWRSVPRMLEVLNGESNDYTDKKLDTVLDTPDNLPNEEIDKVFAVEWYWPYDNNSAYPSNESNASGTYQTKELDTQLGEAILENPDLFKITLNMNVTVEQSQ